VEDSKKNQPGGKNCSQGGQPHAIERSMVEGREVLIKEKPRPKGESNCPPSLRRYIAMVRDWTEPRGRIKNEKDGRDSEVSFIKIKKSSSQKPTSNSPIRGRV